MNRFYLIDGYYDSGPFTISQLQDRNVQRNTVVKKEKSPARMLAGDVAELESLFNNSAPEIKERLSPSFKMRFNQLLKKLRFPSSNFN